MRTLALLLPLLLWLPSAGAATIASDFSVNTAVAPNCRVNSAGTMAFGEYKPISTNATAHLDAQSAISVSCTNGASSVAVGLNAGLRFFPGAVCDGQRRLWGPANGTVLLYDLYQDAGRTIAWSCSSAAVLPTFTSATTPVVLTAYGRVPAGQPGAVDNYTDAVTVIVTF